MRSASPLVRVLRGAAEAPPPVWLMRQAGRHLPEYRKLRAQAADFLAFCYTPDLAVEATLQPVRRYGLDAAIVFSDILVVPDALGQDVGFVAGEGPKLAPIRDAGAVAGLAVERLVEHLAPVYRAIAGVRAALADEVALIGFAGAPWTLATYMVEGGSSRDFAAAKGWALADPAGFGRLVAVLEAAIVDHLVAQARAGADAVQLFDTWAGALDAAAFARWVVAPTRRVVAAFRAACPQTPIIGFPRGAGVGHADYARETGVDGISIDSAVPPRWAAEALQPVVAVQGNIDPIALVAGGDALRCAIAQAQGALGGGRWIANLGHGIVPQTPPEHVAELVAGLRAAAPARAR